MFRVQRRKTGKRKQNCTNAQAQQVSLKERTASRFYTRGERNHNTLNINKRRRSLFTFVQVCFIAVCIGFNTPPQRFPQVSKRGKIDTPREGYPQYIGCQDQGRRYITQQVLNTRTSSTYLITKETQFNALFGEFEDSKLVLSN